MSGTRLLIALARRIMPADRQIWLTAMAVEIDHVSDKERTTFALGCVWSALTERIKHMSSTRSFIRRATCYGALAWSLFYVAVFLWAVAHGERISLAQGDIFYVTIYAPTMSISFALIAWLVGSNREWRITTAAAALLIVGFTALYGLMFATGDDHVIAASKVLGPALMLVSLTTLITGLSGTVMKIVRRTAT